MKKYPNLSRGEIAAAMVSPSPFGLTTEEVLQRMERRKVLKEKMSQQYKQDKKDRKEIKRLMELRKNLK